MSSTWAGLRSGCLHSRRILAEEGGSRWTVSPGKGFRFTIIFSVTMRDDWVLEPLSVRDESVDQKKTLERVQAEVQRRIT